MSVSFLESSNIVKQIDFDSTSDIKPTIGRYPYWKTQKHEELKTKSFKQII